MLKQISAFSAALLLLLSGCGKTDNSDEVKARFENGTYSDKTISFSLENAGWSLKGNDIILNGNDAVYIDIDFDGKSSEKRFRERTKSLYEIRGCYSQNTQKEDDYFYCCSSISDNDNYETHCIFYDKKCMAEITVYYDNVLYDDIKKDIDKLKETFSFENTGA